MLGSALMYSTADLSAGGTRNETVPVVVAGPVVVIAAVVEDMIVWELDFDGLGSILHFMTSTRSFYSSLGDYFRLHEMASSVADLA